MPEKKSKTQARVISRQEQTLSPWVRLVSKEITLQPGRPPELYHCLAQADYVAVLARTPGGLIPVVRQYRPAVEAYTWELPGGLVDRGEDPQAACERELLEETGLRVKRVTFLGTQYADTGRLENRQHAFYMETAEPDPKFDPEDGVGVEFVSFEDLKFRMKDGVFLNPLHMAVVMLYELHAGS